MQRGTRRRPSSHRTDRTNPARQARDKLFPWGRRVAAKNAGLAIMMSEGDGLWGTGPWLITGRCSYEGYGHRHANRRLDTEIGPPFAPSGVALTPQGGNPPWCFSGRKGPRVRTCSHTRGNHFMTILIRRETVWSSLTPPANEGRQVGSRKIKEETRIKKRSALGEATGYQWTGWSIALALCLHHGLQPRKKKTGESLAEAKSRAYRVDTWRGRFQVNS